MATTPRQQGSSNDRENRANPDEPRVDDEIRRYRSTRLSAGDRDSRMLDPDDERHSRR